jgi:hypothetical protein
VIADSEARTFKKPKALPAGTAGSPFDRLVGLGTEIKM